MKGKRIVISLLSVLLVLSLMPTMAFAESVPVEENTGEVAIDETNFPDEGFREYINRYDNDHNGILSYEERSSVTSIFLTDGDKIGIKTVKGIEYFPNLLELQCGLSQIKEIDLSHNTNLEGFYCSDSKITEVDLSNNTNLQDLDCSNTEISNLDLSNNTNLQTLDCSDTFLTVLDLSHNTELKELDCSSIPISSLNLNANTKLEKLDCSSTLITALDLKSNSELEELFCSNMRLKDIDISANAKLKRLGCRETFVSSLNLSQNKELTYLLCSNTLLTALDLKENVKLEVLYCDNINISELDLSKNTQLEELSLSFVPITKLDLSNNKKLKFISGDKTRLAWIDLSNNLQIYEGNGFDGEITIETKETSLNLEEQFPGIDVTKISNVKGATLEGAVLTGYDSKTSVEYTYDCGLPSPTLSQMHVTLHITGDDEEENPPDVDQPDDDDTPSGGGIIIIPPADDAKPEVSEGEGYSTFIGDNGKTVLIVVDDEYELTDVKVNGVSKGAKKKITGLKSKDKVEVFVITKAEKIQQIKSTLETVNWKNFLTRSAQVKMKSGKKAIKLTFVNQSEVPFDGIEVFRSMKKNSGYGTKPIFTTTNDKYYNTAIKKGKRYYYKARGYIEYDGVKYYSGWSAKAWRMVK